ncbi:Asd/ArgC dimerization domain-containing protein [Parendozoicomonas sp. Alg238-R29]|uniref:Asd/ArgC dimerization domain-containing protein n=1 Tax=Parendozoicomonas sp. Alg238-R29 TaxID=2993446 RepID=UPI00248EC1C2|nr:Asd/ArgC dimerization domain-containing protein [Parendozoicomonas sp. Alg238-R29]
MSDIPLALVGADTFAGESILSMLAELDLTADKIIAIAGVSDDETTVSLGSHSLPVQSLAKMQFQSGQIVICAGDAELAEEAIGLAGAAGAMVLDATPFSRSQNYASLVHPDVNPEALMTLQQNGVVAVPGDVAMTVAPVLRALRQLGDIGRVDLCCCLSVSSAGKVGVSELAGQTNRLLNGLPAEHSVFSEQTAFNVLPSFVGNCGDAVTAGRELVTLSGHEGMPVHVNSMVASVFYGQVIHLSVSLDWAVGVSEVWDVLEGIPSVKIAADPEESFTPVSLVSADEDQRRLVHICGLGSSEAQENVLNMWIVSDNSRSGSASGAVQLYQWLITEFLQ